MGGGACPLLTLPDPAFFQDFPRRLSLANWELPGTCWKLLKGKRLHVPRRLSRCTIL